MATRAFLMSQRGIWRATSNCSTITDEFIPHSLPDTTRSPHRVPEFTARRVNGRETRSPENAGQPSLSAGGTGASQQKSSEQ